MDSNHPFSCLTCQLAFAASAAQRAHYSTDLHRYNAKRKVAELPPVSAQVFNEKIVERREKLASVSGKGIAEAASESTTAQPEKLSCKPCGKAFNSQNAYDDHLKSRKHRDSVFKAFGQVKPNAASTSDKKDDSTEVVESANESSPMVASTSSQSLPEAKHAEGSMPSIPPNACLFCTRSFTTLEINLNHMSRNHGFHVPDQAFCSDIPGLLAQIADDISMGNICITCGLGFGGHVTGNESDAQLVKRARKGLDAVRSHMIDKGHTRLPWDTEDQRLRYSDHYDYRSSYPDYVAGRDGSDGEAPEMEIDDAGAGDWEDADDEDIDEDDEVVMDYSAVRRTIRKPMEDDMDYRLAVANGDYELILPSGARVGHRALKGVYKQNIMPYIDLSEPKDKVSRLAAALEARSARKDASSSALVETKKGLPLVVARNAGEAKYARKAIREFADFRKIHEHRNRIAKSGNNQKHFRDPLLQ